MDPIPRADLVKRLQMQAERARVVKSAAAINSAVVNESEPAAQPGVAPGDTLHPSPRLTYEGKNPAV